VGGGDEEFSIFDFRFSIGMAARGKAGCLHHDAPGEHGEYKGNMTEAVFCAVLKHAFRARRAGARGCKNREAALTGTVVIFFAPFCSKMNQNDPI
jgi:hypothetical protein